MKYTLLTACLVATLFAACKDDQATKADTPKETATDTTAAKPDIEQAKEKTEEPEPVQHSLVSGDLDKVSMVFNGTEYVKAEMSGKPDYFILYYTASW